MSGPRPERRRKNRSEVGSSRGTVGRLRRGRPVTRRRDSPRSDPASAAGGSGCTASTPPRPSAVPLPLVLERELELAGERDVREVPVERPRRLRHDLLTLRVVEAPASEEPPVDDRVLLHLAVGFADRRRGDRPALRLFEREVLDVLRPVVLLVDDVVVGTDPLLDLLVALDAEHMPADALLHHPEVRAPAGSSATTGG